MTRPILGRFLERFVDNLPKEELAVYEIVPLSKIIPNWDGLSTAVKAVIESSFNLEWWRGYHARAASLPL